MIGVTPRRINTIILAPVLPTSLADMIDTIREEVRVLLIVPAIVAVEVPRDITEEMMIIITNLHGLDRMGQILLTEHIEGPRIRFMTNGLEAGAAALTDPTIIE